MIEKYTEVIRATKKKKKFKTFSRNMCQLKKPALQLEESKKQKLKKVQKFCDNTMEKAPLRNNDVIMESVENEELGSVTGKRVANTETARDEEIEDDELTPRKTTSAFSPSFFPDPDDVNRAKVITPEKTQGEMPIEPEEQKRTILNLVKIIGEVAASINIDVAQEDLTAMKTWDICALRKKLGDFNKKKMLLNSPPAAKFDHGQQHRNMFANPNEEIYDDQGLNVAAVSTDTQPCEKFLKTKPPKVTSVLKNNSKNKSQVRHSYTARLRLNLSKFDSVNVGFVLRQMFQLWKEADSSIILLAHNDEENADMWIDDIQKIPDEQNLVEEYVAGLYQYNEKLHFSLRFSGHQDLKKMKLKIFAWMKSNDSFVTIDKVKAVLVHTIGFFYKIHPDFFNREVLKQDEKKKKNTKI